MGQTICCLLLMTINNPVNPGRKMTLYLKYFFSVQIIASSFFVPSCQAAVNYTIGVLCPWNTSSPDVYPFWAPRTLGAVSIAIDDVNAAGLLGEENRLKFVYKDTDCDTKQASGSAVELFMNEQVDSFVAPPCSFPCNSVNDLTAFWRKPTTAWFCAEIEREKHEYIYLARTYTPFTNLCRIAVTTMRYYDWKSASIIFPNRTTWKTLAFFIIEHLEANNIDVSQYHEYAYPFSLEKAKDILADIKAESHVIWLIVGGITTLEEDEHLFMLAAHQLEMTNGNYVFLRIELYPSPGYTQPWMPLERHLPEMDMLAEDDLQTILREAYEAMLLFTYRLPQDGRLEAFLDQVPSAFNKLPFTDTFPENPKDLNESASIMAAFLYDAIWLYANSLNSTVGPGPISDGLYIYNNASFEGMTGYVVLNSMGDRVYNFSLMDFKNSSVFHPVGYLNGQSPTIEMIPGASVSWPGATVPRKPSCGYKGKECIEYSMIIAIVVGCLAILAVIITIPFVSSVSYQKFIARRDWLMEIGDLVLLPQVTMSEVQNYLSTNNLRSASNTRSNLGIRTPTNQTKINKFASHIKEKLPKEMPRSVLATYASETVVLEKAQLEHFHLNKALRQELKEMRWLVHENLVCFLGICFPVKNSDVFYNITEYCPKGSLINVLANEDMMLDFSFRVSFIFDIAKGMQYLHHSTIKSHGILCSRVCFVDARWVTKITGFGSVSYQLFMKKVKKQADPNKRFAKMLWSAPEVLRSEMPLKGSQRGDVYSFGIMIHEILTRNIPYSKTGKTYKAIICDVMKRKDPPFRPSVAELEHVRSETDLLGELIELMRDCWQELPERRPDFKKINARFNRIQKGRKNMNIMDCMLAKMAKYTENLEKVVSERTALLLEEKSKTDMLLYRMLPEAVAESLKKGEPYMGEFYECVTLYFSDIVGFTMLSVESTPMEVVTMLNDLYSCFDAVVERFDVYKIETIGDAYMVSSGLPHRNGSEHAPAVANMSLSILQAVKTFRIRHKPDHQCCCRIGINSGPVAAGVVGLTMPRFCLFGDTVNTASRMESNGLPQKIHISSSTAAMLVEAGGFVLEKRGEMEIKGKGLMATFWLNGTTNAPSQSTVVHEKSGFIEFKQTYCTTITNNIPSTMSLSS